ncbi:NADH:ubiquinone reductase (Na(+)-transporting) subunit D [Hoylesella loescheii]|jgi:NADH:ubiquinone oxidoreductase, D subunit|uniref:Na(+)-translocating NADH-quinone reductase subunit D n=1 Tax=Hoylesella loescheii DSM 19665 = JCM 12249 = ATCC 15930 TaxID=1122985 RepID=A0A069QFR4_HOYLO|nr:NADH:ubiquinone reductase (Na(+)-transporting) subunit D [Hoylesella loescheii]KDR51693.1 NADH:ubiquinone oxidoreductase, D subunit [Hoylesella loescheii DSM 19665 = JCM 12249 = ATCC 15930]
MSKLFSKENKEVFVNPLNLDHPIMVQVLGICSALAVTSQLKPAIVMGLAVTIITAFSNVIISLIRNTIPSRIRIIVQLVVVAALVTVVSQILKAFVYDVSVELSVYVGLIITNCILMGRLEAFAMMNKPWPSFLDGVGNGLGYAFILVLVGGIREFFGRGSLLGFQLIPESAYNAGYLNNGMMTMPAMALILLGCVIWLHRAYFYKEKN